MASASTGTTSGGVFEGTQVPYQIGKSNRKAVGPASLSVTTSGMTRERRAVVTPSAMSRPARRCGSVIAMGAMAKVCRPGQDVVDRVDDPFLSMRGDMSRIDPQLSIEDFDTHVRRGACAS